MLYNVVLASAGQKSEPVTCIHTVPLPWLSFPLRSLQSTEFPALYCRSSLVVCLIHSRVYVSIPTPQFIPTSWGDFLVMF